MVIRFSVLKYLNFLFIIMGLNTTVLVFGQVSDKSKFEVHYNNSVGLNKLSLFSESIKELDIAIKIARKNNWQDKYLESSVFMGEMMRRTGDHKMGLEILERLTNSKKNPKLHARKLGRMAALYAEGSHFEGRSPKDSIIKYLKKAIKIAIENKFYAEEASLSNELGFLKLNNDNLKEAKPYLLRSAMLFKEIKDDNNYVVVMCHVLYVYTKEGDFKKADKIIIELLELIEGNKWYGTEQTLYRNISKRYLKTGDSISYYKWMAKEKDAAQKLLSERGSKEMSYYRVKYDTEKYKNIAIKAKLKFEEQKRDNNIILVFMIVFVILTVVVVILFLKKKRLAKKLVISNEKFQMLMVESNHRIKNNLQMILSLVDYSNDKANKSETKTLNKISRKIQTIGVLHKHLYIDEHNEFVSLDIYFAEIIRLYSKMNPTTLIINEDCFPVKIKSERIVYFGLILNELLANTLEHNLSEIKTVRIKVTSKNKHEFIFEYCDNSLYKDTLIQGKGSLLLNQLITRIKGTNYKLDKETGNHKFIFNDVV
jgi:two-component sensor histidine kinase